MRKESAEILGNLREMEKAGKLEGVFTDIPIEVYHAGPGVSSTTLKKFYISSRDNLDAFRFGNAFHTFINEPHLFDATYEVVSRTKGDSGKIGITFAEFEQIKAMHDSLSNNPMAKGLLDGASFELTFYKRDEETGILKKCRADIYKPGKIADLKSTQSVSEYSFQSDCRRFLYRLSAGYYSEIIEEITGVAHDFSLIACEKSAPFATEVFQVAYQSIEKGRMEARAALRRMAGIADSDTKQIVI